VNVYDFLVHMRPPASLRSRVWIIGSSKQNRQVDWYRWEFVRRNPEFVADYNRFAASFGAWLKGQDFEVEKWTDQDKELFHSKIEPVLIELCRKWQINELFPPELDREDAVTASENGDQRIIPLHWWGPDSNEGPYLSRPRNFPLPVQILIWHSQRRHEHNRIESQPTATCN
jgi:hypothetical protein